MNWNTEPDAACRCLRIPPDNAPAGPSRGNSYATLLNSGERRALLRSPGKGLGTDATDKRGTSLRGRPGQARYSDAVRPRARRDARSATENSASTRGGCAFLAGVFGDTARNLYKLIGQDSQHTPVEKVRRKTSPTDTRNTSTEIRNQRSRYLRALTPRTPTHLNTASGGYDLGAGWRGEEITSADKGE